ncbi:protein enabled homolog [Gymnodraco acuticeps]|uniref:Protein enabled homolog n=1 Tax=Gymnodraco acuticeps TaxID=8218 RepID=A0A6P8UGT3_GYMAC|nr:protein enabled homolog [Gymnodraco acuticeps]
MGSCCSKTRGKKIETEIVILSGDAKWMKVIAWNECEEIKKWQNKYNFQGRLVVEECQQLIDSIENKCNGNRKREEEEDLLGAMMWLAETRNRREGHEREVERRQRAEKIAASEKEKANSEKKKSENEVLYNLYPNLPYSEKLEKLDDQVICRRRQPPPPYLPPVGPAVMQEQWIDENHAPAQHPGDLLGPLTSCSSHPSAPPPTPLPWPPAPPYHPPPPTDPHAPAQRTAGMREEPSNTRSGST